MRALRRIHRVDAADAQARDVRLPPLTDDLHVAEDHRVTRVIEARAVLQRNNIAACFTPIEDLIAIRNTAAMHRVCHGHFDAIALDRAAFIKADDVLYALFVEPGDGLKNADCSGVVLGGQTQCIADMIEVWVGDEQRVDLSWIFEARWTDWILLEPRVDDPVFAALRFDRKAGLPTEGNLFVPRFIRPSSALPLVLLRSA